MSRYEITKPIDEGDKHAALAFVEEALQPAGEEFVLSELGRLRALTVSRDIGQDLLLVFAAYTDELMRYPADAVREVLRGWGGKFWPAWAELESKLDVIIAPRKALREALNRGYCEPEADAPVAEPDEDRERVVAEILAKYGVRLDSRGGRERPLEREPLTKIDPERDERVLPEIRAMWIARLLGDTGAAP